MSSTEAKSKAEDVGASVVGEEAKHSEPSDDKTALDDEADTLSGQDDTSKLKPSAAQRPDAKDETTVKQAGSKSLHELGFTNEQIAAILSSTEVSSLKSASNAGDEEITHLKSLSAAVVRTRDSLSRNFEWLGDVDGRIVASPAESRRLVSSAQEAIHSLSRVVRSRGLQEKFIDEMDDWNGRDPVPVQEGHGRSARPMMDQRLGSPPAASGAAHGWRNTVPVGAPKADVVRPATKSKGKRFGLWASKSRLDE